MYFLNFNKIASWYNIYKNTNYCININNVLLNLESENLNINQIFLQKRLDKN